MPNRILKESICTSDEIAKLSRDAEVLFYRLIVQCDDYGRMDGRVAIIRARCYPLQLDIVSEADISAWLAELVTVGLVAVYTVRGRPYLQLVSWERHQQIRAAHSKYPGPDEADGIDQQSSIRDSTCYQMIANDSSCNQMLANVPVNRESLIVNRESRSGTEDGATGADNASFHAELSAFSSRIHLIANPIQAQEMIDRLKDLRQAGVLGWWDMALKVAEDNNARRWSYIRAILDRCLREGKPPGAAKTTGGRNGTEKHRADTGRKTIDDEYQQLNTPERIAALRAEWDDGT